jgi:hypothetical protein
MHALIFLNTMIMIVSTDDVIEICSDLNRYYK